MPYLVIYVFRRIELNYFSVFISFIITIPPISIYISDGMLRILGTARVRLFDATHWRFVLRAAYRQQHGWRWQFDSTFRLGRNYLHHTEHAIETGDVFSFETWIISYVLTEKKGTLDICLFYSATECRRWHFSFVVKGKKRNGMRGFSSRFLNLLQVQHKIRDRYLMTSHLCYYNRRRKGEYLTRLKWPMEMHGALNLITSVRTWWRVDARHKE